MGAVLSEEGTRFDDLCHPPNQTPHEVDGFAEDVYGLGTILSLLLGKLVRGRLPANSQSEKRILLEHRHTTNLDELLLRMRAVDPIERPRAQDVARQLETMSDEAVIPTSALGPRTETERDDDRDVGHLAHPIFDTTSPASVPTATPDELSPTVLDAPLPRGYRLGRFRLLQQVGQGSMGSVYQAADAADGSLVAVKVLSPRYADQPAALKRFRKEGRLLAEVNNPYVARLLEVNEAERIQYLVMEYVDGRSLAELLNEQERFDERTAVSMMADVARALVEPHEQGIVHRDIKPGNILVVSPVRCATDDVQQSEPGSVPSSPPSDTADSPPSPQVKLIDFGTWLSQTRWM